MAKYFYVCPLCSSHLDPEERCDCTETEKKADPQPRKQPLTKPLTKVPKASLSIPAMDVKVPRGCMNG